jgi:hypothetical protein
MPVQGIAHIFGGGTVAHVRPHLSLMAPAYGKTARDLNWLLLRKGWSTTTHLTKMAGGNDDIETNQDVRNRVDHLLQLPDTKVIVMSAALVDFEGEVLDANMLPTASGKKQPRLETAFGEQYLKLTPTEKVIQTIRAIRKDVFLVGFKTTSRKSHDDQYRAGLGLLKSASCNLVLANDVHTRVNMVITPEQAIYEISRDRSETLNTLADMITARANLTFTRSTVLAGEPVAWESPDVPPSLRKVVNWCIANQAYKPFKGATVGHFASKMGPGQFLTSIRKTDFNKLSKVGLVRVETKDENEVIAYGAKPSVGGQSQRIVFEQHPDTDCIVHFHCPLLPRAPDAIPVRPQQWLECGSHQCGKNTSEGLKSFGDFKAVMLQQHGPNIVFNRSADPDKIIDFIHRNFDTQKSTDGVLI